MVTFRLVKRNNNLLTYLYYPEGKEFSLPGEIIVNLQTSAIKITKTAAEDWERDIPLEELNEAAESLKQMLREQGKKDFIALATEPEHSVYYGDHAVRGIAKYIRKGEIPESGMQAWY